MPRLVRLVGHSEEITMSNGQSIAANPALARHAKALNRLGYRTLEDVAGAAAAAADALSAYLGEDVRPALPAAAYTAMAAPHDFPLGVALDRIPPPIVAFALPAAPPAGPLPSSADLTAQMPPIRDQGHRGTCVAHAALAAVYNLRTAQGPLVARPQHFRSCHRNHNYGHPTSRA